MTQPKSNRRASAGHASLKFADCIHRPMKRLILILNGKGGVGKSFFAVNLIQYLKDKGIAHVAIDSDNENSTLKRFHPDARFLDLENRRELDGIFTALEKANLVVMDCRAASSDLFIEYFTEIDLPAVLSALGAALTLVMPVNHESDSVDQIQRLADHFETQCNYVVVRNAAHSDSFALFESAAVRTQLAERLGGREITMTRLQDWLVEALNDENLTITASAKHPAFSLLDRQRLQSWQRRLYAGIETVTDLLLPTK
ncbi:hypothetical protein GC207_02430 [bacterium]|nr:hypothetical protein [bacterium]